MLDDRWLFGRLGLLGFSYVRCGSSKLQYAYLELAKINLSRSLDRYEFKKNSHPLAITSTLSIRQTELLVTVSVMVRLHRLI